MSGTSVQFAVAYEYNGSGGWTAMVYGPTPQYDKALREHTLIKSDDHPYRYRNVRLLQQMTSVYEWEEVTP